MSKCPRLGLRKACRDLFCRFFGKDARTHTHTQNKITFRHFVIIKISFGVSFKRLHCRCVSFGFSFSVTRLWGRGGLYLPGAYAARSLHVLHGQYERQPCWSVGAASLVSTSGCISQLIPRPIVSVRPTSLLLHE
jgi:hypothetical protein